MAIKNLVTRIPQAGNIRLGTPKTEFAPGRNVPYFRIEIKKGPDLILTPEFMAKVYGEKPEKLRVYFPRKDINDPEASELFIFDSNYKAFKAGKSFCVGNGEKAIQSVSKTEVREVPCTCEFLNGPKPICKQRGEVRVGLVDIPFIGFFQITTTSWNSIASIDAVIKMYKQMLGAKFWTTKFVLYKEPVILKGNPQYLVKLIIDPEDANLLGLPQMNQYTSPQMLIEEDEWEQAEESSTAQADFIPEPVKPASKISEEPVFHEEQYEDTTAYEEYEEYAPSQTEQPLNESASRTEAPPPVVPEVPASIPFAKIEETPALQGVERHIDPKRRTTEKRLIKTINDYMDDQKVLIEDAFKAGETAEIVLNMFCGKTIEQLTDAELQGEMGRFYQLFKDIHPMAHEKRANAGKA